MTLAKSASIHLGRFEPSIGTLLGIIINDDKHLEINSAQGTSKSSLNNLEAERIELRDAEQNKAFIFSNAKLTYDKATETVKIIGKLTIHPIA
jgi:hypothetical protein